MPMTYRAAKSIEQSTEIQSVQLRDYDATSSVTAQSAKRKQLSDGEVFVAILKGDCNLNAMMVPSKFYKGGWAMGMLSMNVAWFIAMSSAILLVRCAIKT